LGGFDCHEGAFGDSKRWIDEWLEPVFRAVTERRKTHHYYWRAMTGSSNASTSPITDPSVWRLPPGPAAFHIRSVVFAPETPSNAVFRNVGVHNDIGTEQRRTYSPPARAGNDAESFNELLYRASSARHYTVLFAGTCALSDVLMTQQHG
jgi:hypothetical protein